MKAAILVEDNYQELELWYSYYRLIEEGISVDIVGPEANKTYKSKLGYPVKSNEAADKVSAESYDIVLIPGGYAPERMRTNSSMIKLVKKTFEEGKVVAAICHGAWVLCSSGILKNKNITCYNAIKDDVVHAGANYQDKSVVVDENLITSRKPDDLPDFCKAILAKLM